jgi:hypothetical protein
MPLLHWSRHSQELPAYMECDGVKKFVAYGGSIDESVPSYGTGFSFYLSATHCSSCYNAWYQIRHILLSIASVSKGQVFAIRLQDLPTIATPVPLQVHALGDPWCCSLSAKYLNLGHLALAIQFIQMPLRHSAEILMLTSRRDTPGILECPRFPGKNASKCLFS